MMRVIPWLLLLLACDGELTQIVVHVETDLAVPDAVDRVEVDVFGLGPSTQSSGGGLDPARRMRTVTLVHDGGPLGPIEVVARALHGGAPVVERHARVWFAAERTQLLRMRLVDSCRDASCGADQTCDETGCRSILHDLEPWPPAQQQGRDAGAVPVADAGPSASGDAAAPHDAGTDAGCVAVAETCNGADDDCDERADETFDLASDPAHCGACMNACDAADVCVASECRHPHEAVAVATGNGHSCAARLDGSVVCWGGNGDCELGLDGAGGGTSLVLVDGAARIVDVASGSRHTCALDDLGSVYCWGANDRYQSGQTGSSDLCVATLVPALTAVAISTGDDHSCAIDDAGALWCWGDDSSNQIGAAGERALPTAIAVPEIAVHVSAGGAHTCAALSSGAVACWGSNSEGQLGRSSSSGVGLAPVAARVIRVAAGVEHTCALGDDGSVECWGQNDSGQLGVAGGSRTTPALVAITGVVDLDAGETHTCAVLASGAASCWGGNSEGELGDGTMTRRPTPTAVSVLADATRASAGRDHTCVLRSTGAVSCFGENSSGELGRAGDARVPADVVGIP